MLHALNQISAARFEHINFLACDPLFVHSIGKIVRDLSRLKRVRFHLRPKSQNRGTKKESDDVHRACAKSQREQGRQETTCGPSLIGRTGGEIHS